MSQKDTFLLLVGIGISFALALLFDYQYRKKLAYEMQKNQPQPFDFTQFGYQGENNPTPVEEEPVFTINTVNKEKLIASFS